MAENVKLSRFESSKKSLTKFFKEIRNELKKVIWPNRAQLTKSTVTVLMACLVIGIIIWIFDFLLTYGVEKLFNLKP
jgi:preprotein translocase subunit SecE